ncbi:MAG: transketolase C-terminal domain-containing protein [Vicinamibacterales bacterium]
MRVRGRHHCGPVLCRAQVRCENPHHPGADRFVLSKGHAAPILYAAWAEAGLFDRSELLKVRDISSDLEGHPTPRLSFVDVATGSLGQGICAAIGSALNARRIGSDYRTYCLIGDGESAEGSVWEAAEVAAQDALDNLCCITDVNGLGQSRPTMWQHDLEQFARRWRAFGWHTIVINGHDINQVLDAFAEARATKGQPTMIVAGTVKGKGIAFTEGKDNWHGKAFKKGEEEDKVIAELNAQFVPQQEGLDLAASITKPASRPAAPAAPGPMPAPAYKADEQVATREAYGIALAKLGAVDSRIVALDADVKNSTFSDKFEKAFPNRFYQNFIAEQVMVGSAMGLAARGAIPFPSTFAAFLDACGRLRPHGGHQQCQRQAGRLARGRVDRRGRPIADGARGSRDVPGAAELRGALSVRCGEYREARSRDGVARGSGVHAHQPSEDASDLRRGRDVRGIGGLKVLRESAADVATVIGAGVTLFEALKAHDQLKAEGIAIRVIDLYSLQPVAKDALIAAGAATRGRITTVEDHYAAGGIGDAVSEAVSEAGIKVQRIAVREIPRSGKPDELLERFGISASHIVAAVKSLA